MKKIAFYILTCIAFVGLNSCNDYVDVIPDNVATLEDAFEMRSQAEKALFTCYSYMPNHGDVTGNPAFTGADELWLPSDDGNNAYQIARGSQRVVDPYHNHWEGKQGGKKMYEGIRQCNILIENVDDVPDMKQNEKDRWKAEAKFLKGYYHFWLARMYGPIVLVKDNIPIEADEDEVRLPQAPVDSVFNYAVKLMDEAEPYLPDQINSESSELGRITSLISSSVKAQVLVTAASPFFNGNNDYSGFVNSEGEELFNTSSDPEKWERAAIATREAVDMAESSGYQLYEYQQRLSQYTLSDTTITKMSIRNAVAEKWNSEIIWGNTNSMVGAGLQERAFPRGLDPEKVANASVIGDLASPLKIAELFYTDKGLPIKNDETWNYSNRFDLKVADTDERYNLKEGYTTAQFHFDREPRFYANLGFDGGIWYGQGETNDDSSDLLFVSAKEGEPAAPLVKRHNVTGYWPKKLVNYETTLGDGQSFTTKNYPWPVMRLADLYLLHAEALNEADGPGAEVFHFIDLVRERAGVPAVEEAWSQYSNSPDKHQTKEGLRGIIHQERMIELAFEGQRFWDLRRWKKATEILNEPVVGWDLEQSTAEGYYRERLLFQQTFSSRDYLWPISEEVILANNKLNQNPGWD